MAKRGSAHLKKSEGLSAVDSELDEAMARLDRTTQRIDDLLDGEEADEGSVPVNTIDSGEREPQDSTDEKSGDATGTD